MRDVFAFNNMLAMGQPSSDSTYVLLYIDGLFWGVYYMLERPDAHFAAAHMGGSASDWEANNNGHEVDGSAANLPYWNAFQTLASESTSTTYTLAFYEQIQGDNPNGTPNSSYIDYLDPTDYIDYMLMNFYIGNTDWPNHNFYAAIDTADPTGFKFFSWDAEMSMGLVNNGFNSNLNVNVTGYNSSTGTFSYSNANAATMYVALAKNPEFDMAFADQVRQFLFDSGALTPAPAIARYQSQIDAIEEAMVLESARWGNIPTTPGPVPNTQAAWLNTAEWITGTYLPQRTAIVLSQLQTAGLYPSISAPEFYVKGVDEYGGIFNPGDTLSMLYGPTGASLPAGDAIYYTLDGTDPRLLGGALNTASDVFLYNGPITLTIGEEVRARIYNSSTHTWSAISEAEFSPNVSSLRITEVMYDPAPATAAEIAAGYTSVDGKEDFEFIELQNTGATTLPVQGVAFTNGVTYTFPNVSLAAGQYIVACSDPAAFAIRYGSSLLSSVYGANWASVSGYTGHLNNGGEEVTLSSAGGGTVQDFTYDPSWYPQTKGGGFSLTIRSATQDLSLWNSAAGWESSGAPNGSPGKAETTPIPLPGSIVINEVLANPTAGGSDMIELRNTTAAAINVGGWWLSDSSSTLTKYQIAANTSIAAGSYLVLTSAVVPFSLSKDGFTVCLSSNAGGAAGGYRIEQDYGATPPGMSVGLVTTTTGESDFTLLANSSFGEPGGGVYPGAANGLAYVSPIVMSELQYDPSQPTAAETAAGYSDGDDFEYIELYNRSNTTQTLRNYYMANGTGFSFGWVPDGTAYQSQTAEAGATATWTTTVLAAGTYTVYANYSLTDPDGNTRKVDSAAQYTITYPGGSTTVTIDQGTAVSGQLPLGTVTTAGPGQVQVQLLRQATAAPSDWTLAGQVEFVATGVDLVVGGAALTSFATTSGLSTLAPGAYVLLVGDLQAFELRYGTGLPVAGQYTGRQNNKGESMELDQFGAPESSGYIPSYTADAVDYNNVAPWPTQAAGSGPALIRVHVADYGNDPQNWLASGVGAVTNVGAAAGDAGLTLDPIAPSVPTGLAALASVGSSQITLNWSASTDPRSCVSYYIVYRNGTELGTSATTSYVDMTAASATNYAYSVSAVNRDGYDSAQSASIVADLPGVASYAWLDSQHVAIYFNEPLTTASASALGNYRISGGITFSAVALSRTGTAVTLTTSQPLTAGNAYNITMSSLATVSGNPLPASLPLATIYQTPTGEILDQVWQNLDAANTINDLTNPALNPNYPNNPTYSTYLISFEAPSSTGMSDYGQRIQGYIYPPVTGAYVFWIASDDYSQLWLSTDSSPNDIGNSPICYVNGWTNYRSWTTYASQQSASINLVAGQRYYIQALMKQGTGGDNLSVAWQIPGTTFNTSNGTPIPGAYLAPLGGTMDLTPPAAPVGLRAAVTGNNSQITLSWNPVQDTTSGIDHYLIYRDGSQYATSTTASYTDTSGISSMTPHSYKVAAVNYDGVQGQLSPPVSISPVGIAAISVPSATSALVVFSEPLDPASAQQAGNYQLSGGATITAAVLEPDGRSVLLTTSTLGSATYTLTVSNVKTATLSALPVLSTSFSCVPLPSPTSVDIGSPGMPGSASYSGGAWTVTGSGTDVWQTSDQSHYLFVPAATSSSATWIVHISSLMGNSGDSGWTKAGIMARASTSTLVADAFAAETSGNYMTFQWTSGTNTAPNNYVTGGTSAPQWIEMTYDGNGHFNSYYSNSPTLPTSWTQLGSQQTVTMPAGGFDIGLFVSAHNNSSTSTAVFDYNNFMSSGSASYVPPPFAVTVNPLETNNVSPALSGTCSDSTAGVSVRVNGNWYAVANNNGSWTLPAGEIPALASGTYAITVGGVNGAGQTAIATASGSLVVDGASPTVSLPNAGTLNSPLSSLEVDFSKPVWGFSLQNVQLTVNGLGLPLAGATLTTGDNQHWTLGNLAGLTATAGLYNLAITPAGWGVTDAAGNLFSTAASVTWPTQVLTRIEVQSPDGLASDGTESLAAMALDQFGNPMPSQPLFTWSVVGAGSISSTGVFTPPYMAGTTTVRATSGSIVGSFVLTLPGPAQWAGGASASWSGAGSWTSSILGDAVPGPGLRGAVGDGVVFNAAQGGTVTLDGASPSLATVTFSTTAACTIAQGTGPAGTVQLANGADSATVTVTAGSHVISVPLALQSNVTLLPAGGSQLTISGGISGAGQLVMSGSGTVILGGVNSNSGGVEVSAGRLVVISPAALKDKCDLAIGSAAAFAFDSTSVAAPNVDLTQSAAVVSVATTGRVTPSPLVAAAVDLALPAPTFVATIAAPVSTKDPSATVGGGFAGSRLLAPAAVTLAKIRAATIGAAFASHYAGNRPWLENYWDELGYGGPDNKRVSLQAFDAVLADYGQQ